MATARSGHAAISLSTDSVLICGGTDGTNDLKSCERYDPASGTIVWRINASGDVMSGAYIKGHPAKYKPGQAVTKFSEPKFHAEWVETKDGLLRAARYKATEDEKEK